MEQKFDFSQTDPLFVEVARFVVKTGKAQASALQREFEIGFNRAGRILSQLEAAGIVGEAVRCKPRAVLYTAVEFEIYRKREMDLLESDFDREIKKLKKK